MKLLELMQKCDYITDSGSLDVEIKDVIYDSRKVVPGCVFVALKGYNVDGHKFIPDAVERGAKALVVEDKGIAYDGVTTIRVKDSRAALARMSVEYFGRPAEQLKTIAVTGTKGKTTTVAMIRSILETAGIKTGTIGTLGILIGDRIFKTNNTTPESYEIQQAMPISATASIRIWRSTYSARAFCSRYASTASSISTTTTHMNFKESSEEGIAIDAAIERLIADQDQLLLIQRYTGIPVTDIMRWSIGYVDRCGIQKGGFNAKGYSDVVSHFTDWLLCQKNKGKSLKPNQVQTKSQAKEVWNKVKAHLLISSVVPEELISSLDFVQYDPENLSIGIIAPDIKTKTIVNKEYKKIIEESFSRYTSSNIKVRCGIMKQQESQTITR